ncbi:MAG: hypothetical protein AAF696_27865 [Bacteroidota bacterium]
MKNTYTLYFFTCCGIITGLLGACNPNLVAPQPQTGNLVLDTYIAIGDGYSAGFRNTSIFDINSTKGLYQEAQLSSFPNLLVNQFNQATQLTSFESSKLSENGSGYFELEELISPICVDDNIKANFVEITPSDGWDAAATEPIIHQLGIPKLRLSQIGDSSSHNVFLNRLKNSPDQTYLDLIEESAPTFFTLYLGSRDILEYALRGGDDPSYPLISKEDFTDAYARILRIVFLKNPDILRGVVARIPDISEFPYFKSVSPLYEDRVNCNLTRREIYIETRDGRTVPATESVRILLPASYQLGENFGQGEDFGLRASNPIPAEMVLDNQEVNELKIQIEVYNNIIDSLVNEVNQGYEDQRVAIARLDVLLEGLSPGLVEDGLDISATYLSGGFFSLDGLYLTPRGNAMISNEFIKAINGTKSFNAFLSPVNIINYSGVDFP